MRTNPAGVALIKRWESFRADAYLCPAGVPTIGYGHTEDVKLGQRITEHQADVILAHDLERYEQDVRNALGDHLVNENEFSALVSFAYNLGGAALQRSNLLRRLKAGDHRGAADSFGAWVYAAGKKLPGLVSRRAAERELFLTPVPAAPKE